MNVSEIENCAILFEELERRVRKVNLFELSSDPEFDPPPVFDAQRHKPFEERISLMK